ncbi:MAG: hypothetical protein ACLSWY_03185 [Ruthenibacterium lactatiformans]
MAENMKKREARIQKAGGVIGGVIGIASIVFAMAVVVFSAECKAHRNGAGARRGSGTRASIHTRRSPAWNGAMFLTRKSYLGTGTGKISSGTFTNDEFGAYRLHLHNRALRRCRGRSG